MESSIMGLEIIPLFVTMMGRYSYIEMIDIQVLSLGTPHIHVLPHYWRTALCMPLCLKYFEPKV